MSFSNQGAKPYQRAPLAGHPPQLPLSGAGWTYRHNATQALLDAAEIARDLGRRFEPADVEGSDERAVVLRTAAEEYARYYGGDFDFMLEMRAQEAQLRARGRQLSSGQAKAILNCLRAEVAQEARQARQARSGQPLRGGRPGARQAEPEPARLAVDDAGVYVLPDGAIVRVKANQARSRTYAKRCTPSKQDRLMEAGQHEHGEYVWEPGLVEQVAREGRRMTLEEAKAFIVRYGVCARCGRHLKDGKSVEAGLGPVCRRWFEKEAAPTGAA
jgi:Family of unknown function (DUF6011)